MSAHTYRVELGERSYDIHIEPGALSQLGSAMRELFPSARRCMLVSNTVVAPLYLDAVAQSLEASGWTCFRCILPDGERYKTLAHWSRILDSLMDARLARNEPLLAVGGGVVGDMAGFAAASYRRGVPFVQVPTTLLAQVDSSVGGKTGINHPHGKNMIGAFYQPRLVWIDPQVLRTLDARQLRAGLAEVIKYGAIRDRAMLDWIREHMSQALVLDDRVIAELILASCRHKAEIVMADETEQGQRALLNLGHTFGHAIEAMTGYQRYLHGEAVAIGMRMAARLSEQLGYAAAGCEETLVDVLRAAGLPVDVPVFSDQQWLDALGHDKKNVGVRVRFILLRRPGDAFICDAVEEDHIRHLLASFQA